MPTTEGGKLIRCLLAGALVAGLLAGCGGGADEGGTSGDEDQVRAAVEHYTDLTADGDPACAAYLAVDGPLRTASDSGPGEPCGLPKEAVAQLGPLTVDLVTIDGDAAAVTFEGQAVTARLVRVGDSWLVRDFGLSLPAV